MHVEHLGRTLSHFDFFARQVSHAVTARLRGTVEALNFDVRPLVSPVSGRTLGLSCSGGRRDDQGVDIVSRDFCGGMQIIVANCRLAVTDTRVFSGVADVPIEMCPASW